MDETYVMRWFPSTAIALAEFEQKSIYRLGSSKEIEIARSLMPEFEQGADPLSDAEVHTQIQAEKIESAAARLAELRTEAFSHTPLVEVWNSETPDQSYAAAKQAGTLEQDGTKRTIALRQVRKMLAEWGVEHTVKDPHDILGELEAMLAGAIDRQQSRVQQMQESESPEQVLTPQREVLAQRQYIIEAIRSNRDWLIRLSF